jgi:hypothetical protein
MLSPLDGRLSVATLEEALSSLNEALRTHN